MLRRGARTLLRRWTRASTTSRGILASASLMSRCGLHRRSMGSTVRDRETKRGMTDNEGKERDLEEQWRRCVGSEAGLLGCGALPSRRHNKAFPSSEQMTDASLQHEVDDGRPSRRNCRRPGCRGAVAGVGQIHRKP